ncbi:conjugal transfer protein TraS (plasmid) [Edwardsiella tarda]|uniref:conjugal transfer protein TraS n=1 Tax=Edwardsiella tarda TaxID=636 RepID=UPI00266ED115|nr:conjugal transfer protein TraS [Edwardsiella tarda]WKS82978.1 conjugal transfer protein TraS [Edwardsiella tarda]
MITHEKIRQEVNELKEIISRGEADIPSMFECLWPGVLIVVWLSLCGWASDLSRLGEYSGVVSGAVLGIIIMLGTASGRSTALSIPKRFRENSVVFSFLSKKIKLYMISGMLLSLLLSLFCAENAYPFCVFIVPGAVLFYAIMMIDFSRYQLAAFSNVISAFKDSKNA